MDNPARRSEGATDLTKRDYPQVIKYMGSKAKLLDFILSGINDARKSGPVCDLFAGACTLSGAIGNQVDIVSNDIQNYSKIIAHTYLHHMSDKIAKLDTNKILKRAQELVEQKLKPFGTAASYSSITNLKEFQQVDLFNRGMISHDFDTKYYLFLKNYSGTWWSAEQCAWIDSLREVSDDLLLSGVVNAGDHAILLTTIMHAMAYCGQGTGHYAQYRDAKDQRSFEDIMIYRKKSMPALFERKFEALRKWNREHVNLNENHIFSADDYRESLAKLQGATVYADPPYAFVHYSRFYHAIETFTLYDYPVLQSKGDKIVKGRYRDERHQSPFSIRSQVATAFQRLFNGVRASDSNLVLSYSNSAMISIDDTFAIATETLGPSYKIDLLSIDFKHMTMGRRFDRDRAVKEALLVATTK